MDVLKTGVDNVSILFQILEKWARPKMKKKRVHVLKTWCK